MHVYFRVEWSQDWLSGDTLTIIAFRVHGDIKCEKEAINYAISKIKGGGLDIVQLQAGTHVKFVCVPHFL